MGRVEELVRVGEKILQLLVEKGSLDVAEAYRAAGADTPYHVFRRALEELERGNLVRVRRVGCSEVVELLLPA